MSPPPAILFAVTHSGRKGPLLAALAGIAALDGVTSRVVAVDGSGDPWPAEAIAALGLDLTCIAAPPGVGVAGARNAALDHIRDWPGDFLMQMDDDIVLEPDSVRRMVDTLQAEPETGLAAPLVLDENGAVLSAGGDYWRPLGQPVMRTGAPQGVRYPDFATGAIGLLRRTALARIGLFDPRFDPYGFEDVDFCLRLRQAGWRIRLVPEARCRHVTPFTFHAASGLNLQNTTAHRLLCAWKHLPGHWFYMGFLPYFLLRRAAWPWAWALLRGRFDLAAAVARGVRDGWRKRG